MGRRVVAVFATAFVFLVTSTIVNRTLGGLALLLFSGLDPDSLPRWLRVMIGALGLAFSLAVSGAAAWRFWIWGRGESSPTQ